MMFSKYDIPHIFNIFVYNGYSLFITYSLDKAGTSILSKLKLVLFFRKRINFAYKDGDSILQKYRLYVS